MWYYRVREYISWIILFALVTAVAFYGYQLATQQTLLRLGTGPEGSASHAVGQKLSHSIEQYSRYRVNVLPQANSRDAREGLMRGRLDLAVLLPVALSASEGLNSLSAVGQSQTHLILRRGLEPESLSDLAGLALATGETGSDDWRMARDFFRSAGLSGRVDLQAVPTSELEESDALDGAFVSAHRFDAGLRELFASGNYRLMSQSAAGALVAEKPLYEKQAMAPGLYSAADDMIPDRETTTLATPLALMTRADTPRRLIYSLMQVLSEDRTQARLVPYGFERERFLEGQPVLPRHPAAHEYLNPDHLFAFVADGVRVLREYRWLVLLILLTAAMGIYRWVTLRRARQARLHDEQHQAARQMLNEVLKIESAQKAEKDWKVLEQYGRDLAALKSRGLTLMLDAGMGDSVLSVVFTQQCNHVADELKWRLSLRQQRDYQAQTEGRYDS